MGRLARSWDLFKTSLGVIKQDKELLWMPVLSFLATLIALLAIAGVGVVGGLWPETTTADGSPKPLGIVLALTWYIVTAFIALFFSAATIAGATERLNGGDPTVGSALRAAWAKKGKLFLWSIVVATINVILQMIRERSGIVGQMLTSIAGTAWNLATLFMVPVLLFEDKKMGASLRQSGSLFKKNWGESIAGHVGVGLIGVVVSIGIVLTGLLLLFLLGGLGGPVAIGIIAVTVLALIFTAVLFATVGGVFKAALYRYATTGQAGAGFSTAQLGGTVQPKA